MTEVVAIPPSCRSCGSGDLRPVLSLGETPLANSLVAPDQLGDEERRYPLDLAFCTSCALVQITFSVPPEQMFVDYAYFSSFADALVDNARSLTARLVAERGLGGNDLAMEIASNDGYLLKNYVAAGVPVLGIDPAANVVPAAEENGVPTLCAFFGGKVAEELRGSGRRASVMHANNVMAHVPDVNGVVGGIARVLRDDGLFVMETPYVREMVERLEFDTIYHEHLFYYSLSSLSALLNRNGLEIVDVETIPIHGQSLRVSAALPGAQRPTPAVAEMLDAEREAGVDGFAYYEDFGDRVRDLCERLRRMLLDLKAQGRSIAAYGAAAKGATLLNTIDVGDDVIDFVADRSPHKQGRYMPGVRIPIVDPEALLDRKPDVVLLLAWNVAEEVMRQQQRFREGGGRFLVPVPDPHLV